MRKGDDAYPVRTGDLHVGVDRVEATVHYAGFDVHLAWILGETPRLVLASKSPDTLTAQLVLDTPIGTPLSLDGNTACTFGEDATTIERVQSVAASAWQVSADQPGRLIWYVAPFNPYSAGNKSAPNTRRPVFAVAWSGRVEFAFSARI